MGLSQLFNLLALLALLVSQSSAIKLRSGLALKVGSQAAAVRDLNKKVTETALVWAHDSGTWKAGNFGCGSLQAHSVGFAAQLDCGARAFDLRFLWDDNQWKLYHAPSPEAAWGGMMYTTEELIPEIKNWANEHPGELVLLTVSHTNDDHLGALQEWFRVNGNFHVQDCSGGKFGGMLYREALENSKLPGGGSVMVVTNCVNDGYSLFEDVKNQNVDKLKKALSETAEYVTENPDYQNALFGVQTIWQNNFGPDLLYNIMERSMFEVEGIDGINKWTAQNYPYGIKGGLWLADNLCYGGLEMARALGTPITDSDAYKCIDSCSNHANKCGNAGGPP